MGHLPQADDVKTVAVPQEDLCIAAAFVAIAARTGLPEGTTMAKHASELLRTMIDPMGLQDAQASCNDVLCSIASRDALAAEERGLPPEQGRTLRF